MYIYIYPSTINLWYKILTTLLDKNLTRNNQKILMSMFMLMTQLYFPQVSPPLRSQFQLVYLHIRLITLFKYNFPDKPIGPTIYCYALLLFCKLSICDVTSTQVVLKEPQRH